MSGSRGQGGHDYPGSPVLISPEEGELWEGGEAGSQGPAARPAMDIYETESRLVVELELPGMDKENIKVFVSRDLLLVEGVKHDQAICLEGSSSQVSYLRLERKLGRFRREVRLPVPCNTWKGKATYRNGVLTVSFEKIKERRGQLVRIPVE